MKKRVKSAIITATALIILGIVVSGLGFWGMGFNLRALNTEDMICTTFETTDAFRDISIETDIADLYFLASEDGVCRVDCVDFANKTYAVNVKKGTLTIVKNDNRAWHENNGLAPIGEARVTVYLPEEKYASLQIDENTGNIEMPSAFSFEQAMINTSTGGVYWFAPVSEKLSITSDTGDVEVRSTSPRSLALKTDTGDISASEVQNTQQIYIETDSGKIELINAGCMSLSANSSTGDIALKNVIANELLVIKNDTGVVVFDRSDAAEIYVQTDTGDVLGSLLSEKVFLTETDTGDVDVPKSVTGGRCEIVTDTGDISITIQP